MSLFFLDQITLPNVRLGYTANYLKDINQYLMNEIKYLSIFLNNLNIINTNTTNLEYNTLINNMLLNIDNNLLILKNFYQLSVQTKYLDVENYVKNDLTTLYTSQNYIFNLLSLYFGYWQTKMCLYNNMSYMSINEIENLIDIMTCFNHFVSISLVLSETTLNNKLSTNHYITIWLQSKINNYKNLANYIKNMLLQLNNMINMLNSNQTLSSNVHSNYFYWLKKFTFEINLLLSYNLNLLIQNNSYSVSIDSLTKQTFLLSSDNKTLSLISDGKPFQSDLINNSWSFINTTSGWKINLYLGFSDPIQSILIQDIKSIYFIINTISNVSKPFFVLYTYPTSGYSGWYSSKKAFANYTTNNNQWTLVYWGEDPTINYNQYLSSFDNKVLITHDPTDAQSFVSNIGQTDFNSTDLLSYLVLSSNSSASPNNVNFLLKQFGFITNKKVEITNFVSKKQSSFLEYNL
jgi:hypothetical protein